jgi:type IV pilus assembly protein PilX
MNIEISLRARQTGATLIVGLILLLVLTVVGVSGMNTSTLQVAMSGSSVYQQDAFQMAEDGIDIAIGSRGFSTGQPLLVNWTGNPDYDRRSVTTFKIATGIPGNSAFSQGQGINVPQAWHYDIISVGKGARNATATHTQSFFMPGAGGN